MWKSFDQSLLSEDHRQLRVVADLSQPVDRLGCVERHIGRSGFVDGQRTDHPIDRSLDQQSHERTTLDTGRDEPLRDSFGAATQLLMGDLLGMANDSHFDPLRMSDHEPPDALQERF
jgi:hypothetical protein